MGHGMTIHSATAQQQPTLRVCVQLYDMPDTCIYNITINVRLRAYFAFPARLRRGTGEQHPEITHNMI